MPVIVGYQLKFNCQIWKSAQAGEDMTRVIMIARTIRFMIPPINNELSNLPEIEHLADESLQCHRNTESEPL